MRTNEKRLPMGRLSVNVESASQRRASSGAAGFDKAAGAASLSAAAVGNSANCSAALLGGRGYETDEWHDLGGEG